MKLYEFLQNIKDTGLEHTINLRDNNRQGYLSGLDISVYVKKYQFSRQFKERANQKQGEIKFPEDFTEEWKEIKIFIRKSLAKVAIDEE
jgi:hypothetical protein